MYSVADPDPGGSGSVFGSRIRILKVKLSYKNPLFQQNFHDFHLFLKMVPNKSSLFNKIGTVKSGNTGFGIKTGHC